MDTQNPTLPAPEEQVGGAPQVPAEDMRRADVIPPIAGAPACGPADGCSAAAEDAEAAPADQRVDFADEEAALAARDAGLELGEETPEEAEDEAPAAGASDLYAGKSGPELVELFARQLEELPVQSLRREAEALKIAFYKQRRAAVEAERRAFVEQGGAEAEFVASADGDEARLKELFQEYRRRRDEYIAALEAEKQANLAVKLGIIEELKALSGSDEKLDHTFNRFRELQSRWKETGPVPQADLKDLWENYNLQVENFYDFIKINKELRDLDLRRNLERKTALCEEAEALVLNPSVIEAFRRLQKLHKTWKTIGFAPRKDNNRIYERFRAACDRFFEAKRAFYAGVKEEMDRNLKAKTELCEAAEALMESEDWKAATDELIALQARWKETGAVSRRHSDRIWKRFRAACDRFFARKSEHFAAVDGEYEENLRRKLALLDEMEAADAVAGGFELIRDFQRRWSEIGFVPIRRKEAVQKRYKAAADALFEALRGSERDRSMSRFREKAASMRAAGGGRLRSERERLCARVRQLEQDIAVLENNIGFFARSKNADALVADVRAKIERARADMAAAIEKVKLLDRENQDNNNENK